MRIRRWFAALGLGMALSMATPAPSWAAGIGDWQISVLLSGKAWQWMAKLWPDGDDQARDRRVGAVRGKEGSVIDPNGVTTPGDPVPPLPTSDSGEEGSVIDPNG